jgi:uncharacterized protein YjbI with pentapeptide repeats
MTRPVDALRLTDARLTDARLTDAHLTDAHLTDGARAASCFDQSPASAVD